MEDFSDVLYFQTCASRILSIVMTEAVVSLTALRRNPCALARTTTQETAVKQGQVSSVLEPYRKPVQVIMYVCGCFL